MQQTSVTVPDLDTAVPRGQASTLARPWPAVDDGTLAAHRLGRVTPRERGLGRLEVVSGVRAWALLPGGFCATVGIGVEVTLLLSRSSAANLVVVHAGAGVALVIFFLGVLWSWPRLRVVVGRHHARVAEAEIVHAHQDDERVVVVSLAFDTKEGLWLPAPPSWRALAPRSFVVEAAIAERVRGDRVVWKKLLWVRAVDPAVPPPG